MNEKTEFLPYFKTKSSEEEKKLFRFLKRKYYPHLKKILPQHYLVQPIPFKNLEYIKKNSKGFPYFLRFDIKNYFPSIKKDILLKNLEEDYKNISKKETSRRFKYHIRKTIPDFLEKSPYKNGLSIGSPLSHILSGIFLLDIDLKIQNPFLRMVDDYIVFFKKKKDPETFLKNFLLPKLKELDLELNEKKLKSGRTNREKLDFIGFEYYGGFFRIRDEKKKKFEKNIRKVTNLSRKKSQKQILKEINNKILGFGHYYKHCSCKKDFEKLDSFVRMRVRRYFSRNKDSKNKEGNLKITNEFLKLKGLKSLKTIKEKYDEKNKHIFSKNTKKKEKSGKKEKEGFRKNTKEKEVWDFQKEILDELKTITSFLKKLERKRKN